MTRSEDELLARGRQCDSVPTSPCLSPVFIVHHRSYDTRSVGSDDIIEAPAANLPLSCQHNTLDSVLVGRVAVRRFYASLLGHIVRVHV